MPAHRKPAHLVLLNGTAAHDPKKYNARVAGEVTDDRLLTARAPRRQLVSFEQAWAEIIDMCPPGMLRQSDSMLVERAAVVHQHLRNATLLNEMEGHVLPEINVRLEKLFEGMLSKLGASPVDRARVVAPKPKPAAGDFD